MKQLAVSTQNIPFGTVTLTDLPNKVNLFDWNKKETPRMACGWVNYGIILGWTNHLNVISIL